MAVGRSPTPWAKHMEYAFVRVHTSCFCVCAILQLPRGLGNVCGYLPTSGAICHVTDVEMHTLEDFFN